jgi:hypothetical protein
VAYKFSDKDEEFLHKTWEEWTKGETLGKYKLGMNYMDLRHLYKFFLDTCKESGISSGGSVPPYWGEIWDAAIDKTASRAANEANIEKVVLKLAPRTPADIERLEEEKTLDNMAVSQLEEMAAHYEKMLVDRELGEKYSEFKITLEELEREKKQRRLAEKELEKAVKQVRELKDLVDKLQEELKMRPPAKVYEFIVTRDFKEGVAIYKGGTVLKLSKPEDVEWARRRVAEGVMEEYVEKPPPPPTPKPLTKIVEEAVEELERLS